MRNAVMGQTGQVILSDQLTQARPVKRQIIKYQYQRIHGYWLASVCGPFHSRLYGVCGIGGKKLSAQKALRTNLSNDYGYLGNLIFSDVDESDTVGGR